MQTYQYGEATVLLFDRKRHVRKQTRSVLNVLGFKKFKELQDLEEVRHVLTSQGVELVVLDLDGADCGVLELIGEIRRRRCGLDPFVPILLTAWDAKLTAVRPVLESGADDMLLHPFSTAQMGQRIDSLTAQRKPFVITEDYLGPDRRSSSAVAEDPTSIIVPNALQARVQNQRDAAPSAARIEATLGELRRLKLRNMSRKIWYLANRLKGAPLDPTQGDHYRRELTTLGKSIQLYRKTLLPDDPGHLENLCASLFNVLTGLFGRPPSPKDLELLEQSALALRVASKLDCEQGDGGETIRDEVPNNGRIEANLVRAVLG